MLNIILSTTNGKITREIVGANAHIKSTYIFLDNPRNILGFRTNIPFYYKDAEEFFEVGYYLEMLYNGNIEAFDILKMHEDHVNYKGLEFDMILEREKELVSLSLVLKLKEESTKRYLKLEDPEDLTVKAEIDDEGEVTVKKLAYNSENAYICLRNLMLMKSVLSTGIYDTSSLNKDLLQAIYDGRFTLNGIKKGRADLLKEIDVLLEDVNIPMHPDIEMMDDLLAKIRNVEIKELNIAEV